MDMEGPDQLATASPTCSSVEKKEMVPGVIYLSSIPEGMQYSDIYKIFSELGEVGRISLQVGGKHMLQHLLLLPW